MLAGCWLVGWLAGWGFDGACSVSRPVFFFFFFFFPSIFFLKKQLCGAHCLVTILLSLMHSCSHTREWYRSAVAVQALTAANAVGCGHPMPASRVWQV